MKRKIAFLLALLMAASILAGCGGNKTWTGKHEVEITVNNYGTIRLEVDADSAPKTASQFLNLAKKGFYNNLTASSTASPFTAAARTRTAPARRARPWRASSPPTASTTRSP